MADVSDILDQLGIDYKEVGNDFRVKCWLHEERTPSMFIHQETGVYHCFSCHTKGNLITLLKQHTDMEYHEIILYLQKMSLGGLTEEEQFNSIHDAIRKHAANNPHIITTNNNLIETPLNKKIKSHAYLMDKRKITINEINKYGIRVCVDTNFHGFDYSGWVYIPIYFRGELRSFFLRDPLKGRKIYGKYDRSDILYGYDNLEDYKGIVCLTEGMFDKYFCERIGQQSVAALSNRLLDKQQDSLKTFKEIVIFHDNDKTEAGLYLVKDAINLLLDTKVSVATLPEDVKDCADLDKYTQEDLLQFTKKAFDNRVSLIDFYASERYRKFIIMEHERLHKYQKNKQKEG